MMIRERQIAEELMIEIREFIPFKTDCWTFICDFYEHCYDIRIPRYQYDSLDYEKPPDQVWKDWQLINREEAAPGDVVIIKPPDNPMHLGIMLDDGDLIHTASIGSPPVRIAHLDSIPKQFEVSFARYCGSDHH